MRDKKERLVLILPSGKECKIGFVTPCRDGVVIGTTKLEGKETSHLTVVKKRETVQAHITPEDRKRKRSFFPPKKISELVAHVKSLTQPKVYELSENQLSQRVFYITKKMVKWFDRLENILYEQRISRKETVHVFNFKRLLEESPRLFGLLVKSPDSYFGLCIAQDLLEDKRKVFGITESMELVIPYRKRLYNFDLRSWMGFDFMSTIEREEVANPLSEILRGFGLPQYIKEVESKGFFQKMLSAETEVFKNKKK